METSNIRETQVKRRRRWPEGQFQASFAPALLPAVEDRLSSVLLTQSLSSFLLSDCYFRNYFSPDLRLPASHARFLFSLVTVSLLSNLRPLLSAREIRKRRSLRRILELRHGIRRQVHCDIKGGRLRDSDDTCVRPNHPVDPLCRASR